MGNTIYLVKFILHTSWVSNIDEIKCICAHMVKYANDRIENKASFT